jgi:hypothetical protein
MMGATDQHSRLDLDARVDFLVSATWRLITSFSDSPSSP